MSFPKKGKFFPSVAGTSGSSADSGGPSDKIDFAMLIASALEKTLRDGNVRIKTVAGWTGANERTVKNWVSAQYGPSGGHLIVLMRHSDEVLHSVLSMVGCQDLRVAQKLIVMERHMQELASMIRDLNLTIEP